MVADLKSKVLARSGDVLQIPLGQDYAYGLITSNARLLCWDYRGSAQDDEYLKSPVLFVLWISYRDLLSPKWKNVGHIDARQFDAEANKDYFIQDPISKELFVTKDGTNPIPATYDQCVGLERAASWEARHVEDRLRDHFNGVDCKWIDPVVKPTQ